MVVLGRGGVVSYERGTPVQLCRASPSPLDAHVWKQFRGGPVFKAHRLLHHSTLGSKEIKKKKCGEGGARDLFNTALVSFWGRLIRSCLAESVYEVVLHESIPAHTCQLILYHYSYHVS